MVISSALFLTSVKVIQQLEVLVLAICNLDLMQSTKPTVLYLRRYFWCKQQILVSLSIKTVVPSTSKLSLSLQSYPSCQDFPSETSRIIHALVGHFHTCTIPGGFHIPLMHCTDKNLYLRDCLVKKHRYYRQAGFCQLYCALTNFSD